MRRERVRAHTERLAALTAPVGTNRPVAATDDRGNLVQAFSSRGQAAKWLANRLGRKTSASQIIHYIEHNSEVGGVCWEDASEC